jgi:hypothetical protein
MVKTEQQMLGGPPVSCKFLNMVRRKPVNNFSRARSIGAAPAARIGGLHGA